MQTVFRTVLNCIKNSTGVYDLINSFILPQQSWTWRKKTYMPQNMWPPFIKETESPPLKHIWLHSHWLYMAPYKPEVVCSNRVNRVYNFLTTNYSIKNAMKEWKTDQHATVTPLQCYHHQTLAWLWKDVRVLRMLMQQTSCFEWQLSWAGRYGWNHYQKINKDILWYRYHSTANVCKNIK